MGGFKPTGRHREKVLTAATVRNITNPGMHGDGGGLYLRVDANGAKRWIQRVTIAGKRRDIGLGSVRLVTLSEAREAALENARAIRAGRDPVTERKKALAILTFEQAARKVYDFNKPHWRNEKHGAQWISSLEEYAFPHFGDKRITEVGSADVLRALTPMWDKKPETARRVKQRIGTVFKWAIAQSWRTDNPAENAATGLPRQDRSKVRHRLALPASDVPSAILKVHGSAASRSTKLAFEFLVLTATRSGEVRLATWGEFDLERRLWTIPAERMKMKREHRIPLSVRCLAILHEAAGRQSKDNDAPATEALVFPGSKPDKPLSDMTLSKLMKELSIAAVP